MKTRFALGALALLLTAGAWFHQKSFSETPVWKVPKLLSAMRAKEFCSCHFMLGFEKEYCLKRVGKGYPVFDFSMDLKNKRVRFKNPLAESSAKVVSPRLGCSLL